jgi:hypothetical protein
MMVTFGVGLKYSNVYLAAFTTLIIAGAVTSLLGLFVLWGWPLGAIESISVPTVSILHHSVI